MSKPTKIDITRCFQDDYPIQYTVPVADGVSGFSFVLTIPGYGTVSGTITDAADGEIEFDLANATDEASAPWDATELEVGEYPYYVVMTDTLSNERTIVQGYLSIISRTP